MPTLVLSSVSDWFSAAGSRSRLIVVLLGVANIWRPAITQLYVFGELAPFGVNVMAATDQRPVATDRKSA